TLATYSILLPNLNTLAMQPMGAIAGIAAAVIGTLSTTGGAVLGFLLDQTFDGTVQPLTLGFVVYGLIALWFVLWAERGAADTTAA
ncbi:MAG: MFS transporter, partial [Actinomycetota bacterium]